MKRRKRYPRAMREAYQDNQEARFLQAFPKFALMTKAFQEGAKAFSAAVYQLADTLKKIQPPYWTKYPESDWKKP